MSRFEALLATSDDITAVIRFGAGVRASSAPKVNCGILDNDPDGVMPVNAVLLALTAAPSDGLAKTQIADLIGVEANALTPVIKQLKESGQIDQLGERRGARYALSEQGRAAVASQAGEDD